MSNENVEFLKKQVNTFSKKVLPVHITFKDGYWKRGYIIEESSDFFMLNELKEGPMPVFYSEVEKITKFNPITKRGDGDGAA